MKPRIHTGSISYLNKVAASLRPLGYQVTKRRTWYDQKQTWTFTYSGPLLTL